MSYEQAEKICADIERVPGVKEVVFDDSPEHYNEAAALFSVTFDGENDDEVSVLAMDTLRDMLPAQLVGQDLERLADKLIAALAATSKRDMGKVMGALGKATNGNFDKPAAAAYVGKRLS